MGSDQETTGLESKELAVPREVLQIAAVSCPETWHELAEGPPRRVAGNDRGRTSLQGSATKELQDLLHGLSQVANKASAVQEQAERLHPYYEQVQSLDESISKTKKCYDAFYDKLQKDGVQSPNAILGEMQVCDKDYTEFHQKLDETRKTARESDFPGGEVLSSVELPNLRDGFESRRDNQTQHLWQDIQTLEKEKHGTTEIVDENSVEAQQLNATILEDIFVIVNQTTHDFVRLVLLKEGRNGATPGQMARAARNYGHMFIEGLLKEADAIADEAQRS
ncbi:hypothetical protein NOR_08283 [Metarhizium rileyi]|uniref:Uncharacterized protein n=1 Tax=Metarhizium rileyi (strain RCEF 4871) TaxID=1649241 RepID=A0A166WIK6_METRR|nr:hypothetical protein NOR_08283 [Metarhizium rileyi RCEF 4871]